MLDRPFTAYDALRGVWRRKGLVTLVFLATVTAVIAGTLLMPKTYRSEAKLFLRLGRENATLDATATLGENPVVMMPLDRQAEINSVVELLQSKPIFETVVHTVGAERILDPPEFRGVDAVDNEAIAEPGEPSMGDRVKTQLASVRERLIQWDVLTDLPDTERAIIRLQKKSEIEAFEESNVITVAVENGSPVVARDAVATMVDAYIKEHSRLHRSQFADELLAAETQRIFDELQQRTAELRTIKQEAGVVSADLHRDVLAKRLSELVQSKLDAQAGRDALAGEVERLSEKVESLSETQTMTQTTGAGNSGADGMRQELFRLEMQYQDLLSSYKETHPKVRKLAQQLDQSRQMLEKAESQRQETVLGPNEVRQQAEITLALKQPALEAAERRLRTLETQIGDLYREMDQFTRDERELERLEREIAILENSYRKYQTSLEQARIDDRMRTEEFSNVGIAQPASLNLKPVSPNKLLNLLIGIFAGAMGGMGLAVLLEFFRSTAPPTSRDLTVMVPPSVAPVRLRTPVVATVPTLTADQLAPAPQPVPTRETAGV